MELDIFRIRYDRIPPLCICISTLSDIMFPFLIFFLTLFFSHVLFVGDTMFVVMSINEVDCNIYPEGVRHLSDALQNNSTLMYLYIAGEHYSFFHFDFLSFYYLFVSLFCSSWKHGSILYVYG